MIPVRNLTGEGRVRERAGEAISVSFSPSLSLHKDNENNDRAFIKWCLSQDVYHVMLPKRGRGAGKTEGHCWESEALVLSTLCATQGHTVTRAKSLKQIPQTAQEVPVYISEGSFYKGKFPHH